MNNERILIIFLFASEKSVLKSAGKGSREGLYHWKYKRILLHELQKIDSIFFNDQSFYSRYFILILGE